MKVPVLHLADGVHHFDFLIKGGTLQFYRNEVYPEDIRVHVRVNKFEKNMTCHLEVDTRGHYVCDRCLAEYSRPFHEAFELLFHLGPEKLETDEEDVINISPEMVEIDLTEHLMEYLILAVPMKMLCQEDCRGICPGCGAELNVEPCRCTERPIDPRWEKLRELLK